MRRDVVRPGTRPGCQHENTWSAAGLCLLDPTEPEGIDFTAVK
jgi:hypothetical protein